MFLGILINLLSSLIWFLIGLTVSYYRFIRIIFYSFFHPEEKIRFSLSYLFRIKIEDKYLLIKGNRINQYQPIGGVYKFYPSATSVLNELEIVSDENIPIDSINRNDLRLLVKGKNVYKFLKWFYSKKNREITIHREFCEELIEPGFLTLESLLNFNAEYIRTFQTRLKMSTHFQCNEILIYDIFEVTLSDESIEALKASITTSNNSLMLVSKNNIETENIVVNNLFLKISEHSKYTL